MRDSEAVYMTDPGGHRARGRGHPGHAASLSQGLMEHIPEHTDSCLLADVPNHICVAAPNGLLLLPETLAAADRLN